MDQAPLTNHLCSNRSVLLLHGGALGDFVLACHLARAIVVDASRQACAIARHPIVKWFADREILREGLLDDAVSLHNLYADPGPTGGPFVEYAARFDLILNLLSGPETTLHVNLERVRPGCVCSLNPAPDGSSRHILDQWRDRCAKWVSATQTSTIGTAVAEPLLSEDSRHRLQTVLRERLKLGDERVLVLHPGSGGLSKCAPRECFMELRRAALRARWTVVWMIGPDEVERGDPDWLADLPEGDRLICEPSVGRAADLLAGADAFCGNDSGMAHLAAAIGILSVTWFGPTDPAVWAPIGGQVTTLRFDQLAPRNLADKTIHALSNESASPRSGRRKRRIR